MSWPADETLCPLTPSPEAGFSLIETLVVLGIIAMAMTMAPAIISSVDGSRLRATSNELVSRLREARSQAIRRDAPTEIVLDLGKRGYATSISPGFHAFPSVVDAIEVKPAELLQPDRQVRIRFFGDGTANAARIALRHRAGAQVISVDWL